ncbi:hypothetical protein EON79_14255, partial [bacterium]
GVETVGGKSGPMSPRNLLVTTVGDELEMATNDRSKVVGVAIKDRASILMAGHAADTVIWWDAGSGNWVTSTWFAPDKQLPTWVADLNAARPVDKAAGAVWEPLLADDVYRIARRSPAEKPAANGKPFSHTLSTKLDVGLYGGMISSPVGNEMTFAAATRAVDAEKLGQNDVPDILVINLSTNDYVGHQYGPNSPEVMDITIRTDRLLSDFLNNLNRKVPGGIDNVAMIVSGDHGVVSIPEEANGTYHTGALRGIGGAAVDAIKKAFAAKYGEGKWVLSGLAGQNLYLNRALAKEKGLDMRDLEGFAVETALASPGIFAAFGRHQLLENRVPQYPWLSRVVNGYHNQLGGDVFILEAAGDYDGGGTGTGHGSVWDYDAHVPIIFRARGIKPGVYTRPVHTSDIAPTLSRLLGLSFPTGNVGQPLVDKLEK